MLDVVAMVTKDLPALVIKLINIREWTIANHVYGKSSCDKHIIYCALLQVRRAQHLSVSVDHHQAKVPSINTVQSWHRTEGGSLEEQAIAPADLKPIAASKASERTHIETILQVLHRGYSCLG